MMMIFIANLISRDYHSGLFDIYLLSNVYLCDIYFTKFLFKYYDIVKSHLVKSDRAQSNHNAPSPIRPRLLKNLPIRQQPLQKGGRKSVSNVEHV